MTSTYICLAFACLRTGEGAGGRTGGVEGGGGRITFCQTSLLIFSALKKCLKQRYLLVGSRLLKSRSLVPLRLLLQ